MVLATIDALRLVGYLVDYAGDADDGTRVDAVTAIVKALHGYLIAALLIEVAFGLYELSLPPSTGSTPRRLAAACSGFTIWRT